MCGLALLFAKGLIPSLGGDRMRHFWLACVLLFIGAQWVMAADDGVMESLEAPGDVVLITDPADVFWREARPVYAEKGRHGEILNRDRTEIRSRWTKKESVFSICLPLQKAKSQAVAQHFQRDVSTMGLGCSRGFYWF
jgi:hypothetical protein